MDLTLKEFKDLPPKGLKKALQEEVREMTGRCPSVGKNSLTPTTESKNDRPFSPHPKSIDGIWKRFFTSFQNVSLRPIHLLKGLFQRI